MWEKQLHQMCRTCLNIRIYLNALSITCPYEQFMQLTHKVSILHKQFMQHSNFLNLECKSESDSESQFWESHHSFHQKFLFLHSCNSRQHPFLERTGMSILTKFLHNFHKNFIFLIRDIKLPFSYIMHPFISNVRNICIE